MKDLESYNVEYHVQKQRSADGHDIAECLLSSEEKPEDKQPRKET